MAKKVVAALQIGTSPEGTKATLAKILSYEDEIRSTKVKLVVIPEATLGGYPKGTTFGTYLGYRLQSGREEFVRYYKEAIEIGSGDKYPEVAQLAELSRRTGASIVCGVIERDGSTLYCTMIYLDPKLGYIGKHRKLSPTATERLIWGRGDGSTLTVVDSEVGKLAWRCNLLGEQNAFAKSSYVR